MRSARLVLFALLAFAAAAPSARAQALDAQDATVRDIEFPSESASFPMTEGDEKPGTARWRVVRETGNCCETYVTTTASGRLLDFGGNYVNFSDDLGETWKVAQGDLMLGGEGAIVAAPGGDVLGVGWDPYTGDVLLSFRYEAATGKWRYKTMPLHAPFYDREWIGVVPGPLTVNGQTYPWVSFVKGGWPSKEEWLYSTDGLTYLAASSKFVESLIGPSNNSALAPAVAPEMDFIQANGGMGLTPLGGGRALAAPDFPGGGYTLLNPDNMRWEDYRFPSGEPDGQFHADSRGRLHNVVAGESGFEYRISENGGSTWHSTSVTVDGNIEEIDFRVLGGLGVAAVATHVGSGSVDKDLLFKIDVRTGRPAVLRSYAVGKGDAIAGSGVAEQGTRYDFESVALFPDGRAVVSFVDSDTGGAPAIAIETSEPLPPGFAGGVPSPAGGTPGSVPVLPGVLGDEKGSDASPQTPGVTDSAGPVGTHRVTLTARRRGSRVIVSGHALPRHPGHKVLVQRHIRGRWVTVARPRADRRSAFKAILRLRGKLRLRAVVQGDASGHRRGVSRAVSVRG